MARHPGYTTSWVTLPILARSLQAKNAVCADYQHIRGPANPLVECSRLKSELSMTELETRFATEADVEAISTLVNAAFEVERFFIDGDRIDPGKVREMFGTGRYLLADDNGVLIACVYVELRGQRAYFGLLGVDPSRQGQGLGRKMVEEAESYARTAGCEFMDLRIVNLRAELPPFYRRLGYVETGTEPFAADAKPSQPCHFIRMSKPLGTSRAADRS
jgi:GNAT superfamily N-acetyltransferase